MPDSHEQNPMDNENPVLQEGYATAIAHLAAIVVQFNVPVDVVLTAVNVDLRAVFKT